MAFRVLMMMNVKEILRRAQASQGERRISRETGADRKTVSRYVREAEACGLLLGGELSEAQVHEVAQRVQGRVAPAASEPMEEVARHRERIQGWLAQEKPLKLSKIHILLQRDGLSASYATLRRYAMAELGYSKPAATVRVADAAPGEEAQVDFGQMGWMRDEQSDSKRMLWALIITLCFSRYMFVWPLLRQTTAALIEGLEVAWRFFGGMPRILIPDNTKAIVDKADPLSPKLIAAFVDYVQARGLFVDPARVRKAKDKGRVENQVPYVRENWFEGETFTGLVDARASAEKWSREVAGTRVHGTTRKVPKEVYEREEKAHMQSAPQTPFDVPLWGEAKVHVDHHITFAGALYSVPTMYLSKKVCVRADSLTVRIYLGTELIKMHPRRLAGERSTDPNDYPPGKSAYALRSVDGLIAETRKRGHHIGIYAERILAGPLPWSRMRQCYALIGLCDKYGNGRVEALCQSALAFDVIDIVRLRAMLQKATHTPTQTEAGGKLVILSREPPRFARSERAFVTRTGADDKEGA